MLSLCIFSIIFGIILLPIVIYARKNKKIDDFATTLGIWAAIFLISLAIMFMTDPFLCPI